MSKIGKINISIPEKVKVALSGNVINIEGPLGKKSLNIDLDIFDLNINEGKEISIKPKKINRDTKRLWGMNRSILNNAIIGTNVGYEKILNLWALDLERHLKGKQLNLQLGFSHDINIDIPEGIKASVEKQTIVKISGFDKQQVGLVASKIKSLRPSRTIQRQRYKRKRSIYIKKRRKEKIMKLSTIDRKKFRVRKKLKNCC